MPGFLFTNITYVNSVGVKVIFCSKYFLFHFCFLTQLTTLATGKTINLKQMKRHVFLNQTQFFFKNHSAGVAPYNLVVFRLGGLFCFLFCIFWKLLYTIRSKVIVSFGVCVGKGKIFFIIQDNDSS